MTADIGCSAKTSRCRRCPPRPSRAGALLTADTHVSCPHSSFRVLSPPACLFSFIRGSDISLPPRILLRRRASCFQPRAFVSCPCPVNVLSVSSQPLLNLLSVSSQPPHIVSLLECIASTHTSSLGVLSAHRRIAVARVAHCMPSLFFPLSVYISPGLKIYQII